MAASAAKAAISASMHLARGVRLASGLLLAGQRVDHRGGDFADVREQAGDIAGVFVGAFESGDEEVAGGDRTVAETSAMMSTS